MDGVAKRRCCMEIAIERYFRICKEAIAEGALSLVCLPLKADIPVRVSRSASVPYRGSA